jgi:hypothetical protein
MQGNRHSGANQYGGEDDAECGQGGDGDFDGSLRVDGVDRVDRVDRVFLNFIYFRVRTYYI